MKHQQQEEAKNLYFNTNMSKTEIAEKLGVNRRTILLWCKQNNWDKLKESAIHMPAMVAEKCYYLIDSFANRLLEDCYTGRLHLEDAQTIHLLATSIRKLKNRCTVNESMEMFNFFLEGLKRRNPRLAEEVQPQIEQFIEVRENQEMSDFLLEGFNDDGTLPYPAKAITEQNADRKDLEALDKEIKQAGGDYDLALENWQKSEPPQPATSQPQMTS